MIECIQKWYGSHCDSKWELYEMGIKRFSEILFWKAVN